MMSHAEITNEALKPSDIPAADAPFNVISQFGDTFNGYKQLGSFEACAEIANEQRHASLTELRACLFFEQRRWHHFATHRTRRPSNISESWLRRPGLR